MAARSHSVAARIAHLIGPGKLRVVNGRLSYTTVTNDGASLRLDPRELDTVACHGHVDVTHDALRLLLAHDVELALLTASGSRCRGRLVTGDSPRVTLRLLQYELHRDPAATLGTARDVVRAKIESQIAAARHYRKQGRRPARRSVGALRSLHARVDRAADLDSLRGLEGAASAEWFRWLASLLPAPWSFPCRSIRPPRDPVNALLSLGYTWLLARVSARIEARGLELQLGTLHQYRAGRPSLACDLMEPLRVPFVDRWVVQLTTHRIVSPSDFHATEDGGYRVAPEIFGKLLASWERHGRNAGLDPAIDGAVARAIEGLRRLNVAATPEEK